MSGEHDFFDDFFGPMKDAQTGTARCLDCEKLSKDWPGRGRWLGENVWICPEHVAERDKAAEAEEAEIKAVKARVQSGNGTNADLNFLVAKGVARQIFDDPDSNRPTGIEFVK